MPLDHLAISIPPSHWSKTKDFYLAALAPLGYTEQRNIHDIAVGLGLGPHSADFWIGQSEEKGVTYENGKGPHFAFKVETHELVDNFHEAALKRGATCNGPPGARPMYGPTYYGAFVFDPVGNNVEVVCRDPGEMAKKQ